MSWEKSIFTEPEMDHARDSSILQEKETCQAIKKTDGLVCPA